MPRNTKKVYKIYHIILQKKKHLSAKRSAQLQFLMCSCCVWNTALPVWLQNRRSRCVDSGCGSGEDRPCTSTQRIVSWAPSNKGTRSEVVSGLPWWILHTFPFWCFLSWMGIYRFEFHYLLVLANALQIFPLWKGCFPPPPPWLVPKHGSFQSEPNCLCQN